MAKNETKPIEVGTITEDRRVLLAIKGMPDYKPAKADAAVATLEAADGELKAAETTFTTKKIEFDAVHDALVAKQWAFHNAILSAKKAVVAQYDADSEEVQAIGYKKASEKKAPKPGKKAAPAAK